MRDRNRNFVSWSNRRSHPGFSTRDFFTFFVICRSALRSYMYLFFFRGELGVF